MMTTDIEKTFFDTFGIEPKYNDGCKLADKYWANEELADEYITFDNYMNSCCTHGDSGACFSTCEYAYDDVQYPQITDRILLELICIYLDYRVLATQMSVKHLKQTVLQGLIDLHKQYNLKVGYYEEVRALFKEG